MRLKINKTSDTLLIALISTVVCLYVFKDAWFKLNDLSLANHYDQLKNYFTLLYYTKVQDGGLLSFEGMSYPYTEHILYTDNTPILAIILKLLGVKKTAVGWFNFLILSSYLVAPIIAFGVGRALRFGLITNLIFSLFVVWMNPQIFRLASCSNLAMPIVLLLGLYLLIRLFKSRSTSKIGLYVSVFLLVYISSFIHLYYLILLGFLFLPALLVLLYTNWKHGVSAYGSILGAIAAVYVTIRLTDDNYAIRPKGTMGFNYDRWRSNFENYIQSYKMLDLPSIRVHKEYNPEWFAFLGSGFLLLLVVCLILFFIKKYRSKFSMPTSEKQILTALFLSSVVCVFTSVGNEVALFGSKYPNILNPLYLASHFTDTFNNFRFLSRFSFPAFVCLVTISFYFINRLTSGFGKNIAYAGYFILAFYAIDTVQMIAYERDDFSDSENILDDDSTQDLPDFTADGYDAILPIPFFYVGTEELGYIIDDENDFSSFIYQLSIKNKLPMIASKLSRTPPVMGHKYLSLFQDETDPSLRDQLKGKKILVVKSMKHKGITMRDEPAKYISEHPDLFIKKWSPTFLFEKNQFQYYQIVF